MKRLSLFLTALATLTLLTFQGCKDDDENPAPSPVVDNNSNSGGTNDNNGASENPNTDTNSEARFDAVEPSTFAYGADPGWVTAMENQGYKFYDSDGKETECLSLLKTLGFNAVRLRVWVNPLSDDGIWGLCDKDDVVKKAKRASDLGYKVMIDFHYSDQWCDPSLQSIPKAWSAYTSIEELAEAAYDHTKEVLSAVKNVGVDVLWVQIGNETATGMMYHKYDEKKETKNKEIIALNCAFGTNEGTANYGKVHNKAREAAKEIYPDCKIVVHFQNGQNWDKLKYGLDKLNAGGVQYDILGVSLYPEINESGWYANYIDNAINNLNKVADTYNKDVMICELGVAGIATWDGKRAITNAVIRARSEVSRCKGVYYWEPECFNSFNGYALGGFLANGSPAEALKVFSGLSTLLPENDPNPIVLDETTLIVTDKGSGEQIAIAKLQDNGTYTCTVTVTSTWYNFRVADNKGVYYGVSDWNTQYSFVKGSANDNFWFGDETGTFNVVFDPANEKWSYTKQ